MFDFGLPAFMDVLAEDRRQTLIELSKRKLFRDGETIHETGEEAAFMGWVESGYVLFGKYLEKEGFHSLARLGPGHHFGEFAAIDIHPQVRPLRRLTAVAEGETVVRRIEADSLRTIFKEDPEYARAFHVVTSARLALLLELYDDARRLPSKQRIINFLEIGDIIFHAVRKVWPDDKPMSVRISANDWVEGEGIGPDDAVAIAHLLKEAGVDIIDVSAGQTSKRAQPVYGRMFQTPFSDRIRNEAGIATMAVGNIYEPDHLNSILMAGRADLCCLARPHLADPYWTLHAAADLGYDMQDWAAPYQAGRDQLTRLAARQDVMTGKV